MSEIDKQILENQEKILENEKQILEKDRQIVENQKQILENQEEEITQLKEELHEKDKSNLRNGHTQSANDEKTYKILYNLAVTLGPVVSKEILDILQERIDFYWNQK